MVRNSRVERVLGVRLAQERLDRQKRRLDAHPGRPRLLQSVEVRRGILTWRRAVVFRIGTGVRYG